MKDEQIKEYIGKLKYLIDLLKFKENKAESYIARLEQHLQTDFEKDGYEKMLKRDKCIIEEITNFLDV